MLNFEYYAPTKVIFGKATETVVGQEIKKYGGKRVLIHYGGESARRSGLLDRVEESLRQADIAFATLGGCKAESPSFQGERGNRTCKARKHRLFAGCRRRQRH